MVKGEAAKRGLTNIRTAYAKAEALPFEDESFNLVTRRIAPHHFDSISEFLAEVHRVLKPGALFALVDNVVPQGSVGDYVNAFERLRDPATCAPGPWTNGVMPSTLQACRQLTRSKFTR